MKTCVRCGETKDRSAFPPAGACRACVSEKAKARRQRLTPGPAPAEKTCGRCAAWKPIAAFTRDRERPDGHHRWCRSCLTTMPSRASESRRRERERAAAKAGAAHRTRAEWLQERAEARVRRQEERAEARASRAAAARAERLKRWQPDAHYPGMDAVRARKLVASGRVHGHVIKPDCCSACAQPTPSPRLHAHHEDYEYPLAVRWLCKACHSALHGRTC